MKRKGSKDSMNRKEIKSYLQEKQCNCVLIDDGQVIMTSFEKGILPLYNFIKNGNEIPSGCIEMGDKIIGRAVLSLAAYLGVSYIYTKVVSDTALNLLRDFQMEVEYDEVVPYIFNRNRDGQCPMESALEGVTDPKKAFEIIDRFVIDRNKVRT